MLLCPRRLVSVMMFSVLNFYSPPDRTRWIPLGRHEEENSHICILLAGSSMSPGRGQGPGRHVKMQSALVSSLTGWLDRGIGDACVAVLGPGLP